MKVPIHIHVVVCMYTYTFTYKYKRGQASYTNMVWAKQLGRLRVGRRLGAIQVPIHIHVNMCVYTYTYTYKYKHVARLPQVIPCVQRFSYPASGRTAAPFRAPPHAALSGPAPLRAGPRPPAAANAAALAKR